jgi:hypothetical protein
VRYRLEALDDHDSVLLARHAQRSEPERQAVQDAHAAFVAKVVDGGSKPRRTPSA